MDVFDLSSEAQTNVPYVPIVKSHKKKKHTKAILITPPASRCNKPRNSRTSSPNAHDVSGGSRASTLSVELLNERHEPRVKRQLLKELDLDPSFNLSLSSALEFWLAPCGTLFDILDVAQSYCTNLQKVRLLPAPPMTYCEDLTWSDPSWDESMVYLTSDPENNGVARIRSHSDVAIVGARTQRPDGSVPSFVRHWAQCSGPCRVAWMEKI